MDTTGPGAPVLGSTKEATKRSISGDRGSSSLGGVDKVFTGQAVINTSHLKNQQVKYYNNRKIDDKVVELDVQMVGTALCPLYNMYGRKSHSSIKKAETTSCCGDGHKKLITVGHLSIALYRISPLKAQCGW